MSSFNYTLLPEDFMVSCVWSLSIHGRAALGGKISCFSIIRNALITQLLEILKPHHSNLRPE